MPMNFNYPGNWRRVVYLSVSGVITQIMPAVSRGYGECTQMITVEGEEGSITNFFLDNATCIVDFVPLTEGMQVQVFYNGNLPAPLIYPPQFMAAVVAPQVEGQQVFVGYFNQNLLAADQSLKLNLSAATEVVTCNNQVFTRRPGGHTLVVLYSFTTRSIPPQTSPEKIIVLCGR